MDDWLGYGFECERKMEDASSWSCTIWRALCVAEKPRISKNSAVRSLPANVFRRGSLYFIYSSVYIFLQLLYTPHVDSRLILGYKYLSVCRCFDIYSSIPVHYLVVESSWLLHNKFKNDTSLCNKLIVSCLWCLSEIVI